MGKKEMRSPLAMAAARLEVMMVKVMMVRVTMARVSVGEAVGKSVEMTVGVDAERTMNEDEEIGGTKRFTMDIETSPESRCHLGRPVETYVHAHTHRYTHT
jgi:hypothetical protein